MTPRHGVTLLELLLVIAIMGIVSTVVPFALTHRSDRPAQRTARDSAGLVAREKGISATVCPEPPETTCARFLPDGEVIADDGGLLRQPP